MTPSVPSVAVSSSRPVPKPATAPKTDPRRSAIESRATRTMLDVRNGRYSVSTASWKQRGDEQHEGGLEAVHQPPAPAARGTSTITDCRTRS